MTLVLPGSPPAHPIEIDLTFRFTRDDWLVLAGLRMGTDDGPLRVVNGALAVVVTPEQMVLLRALWADIDGGLTQHYALPAGLDEAEA